MSSWPPPPDLYCKIKANTSSITLKTGNSEKSARLVHYSGIVQKLKIFGWVGGQEVGNGGRNENNCPPHKSHDLYPGPSIFHFFPFTQPVKNYSYRTQSNPKTNFIPLWAGFIPRLVLLGFPGTQAWSFNILLGFRRYFKAAQYNEDNAVWNWRYAIFCVNNVNLPTVLLFIYNSTCQNPIWF